MTSELHKSGDKQQYDAEPHQGDPDMGVTPTVKLMWMTPDPLGAVASFNAIYSGRVIRDLGDVTDDDRYQALADVQQTHLQAPLEAIKLHFLIEGVDRAFTHQLVRQRTAVYAQESMRFAVLGDLVDATTLPPSLAGTSGAWVREHEKDEHLSYDEMKESIPYSYATPEQRQRMKWDWAIDNIDRVYHELVEGGMPAEEARGLLPHATATRIHFITDMRNLKDHAGNRLCTQAQFHWRQVFSQMVNEVRTHGDGRGDDWQFRALADSALFRPVCYQLGHCPFKASFDRACSIRERVDGLAAQGVPSSQWDDSINAAEWLLNPGAART